MSEPWTAEQIAALRDGVSEGAVSEEKPLRVRLTEALTGTQAIRWYFTMSGCHEGVDPKTGSHSWAVPAQPPGYSADDDSYDADGDSSYVVLADGREFYLCPPYDESWGVTGPLIEKYRIRLEPWLAGWAASSEDYGSRLPYGGVRGSRYTCSVQGTHPLYVVCHLLLAMKAAGKLEARP